MAVDANILIYERIREELRNGVTPRAGNRGRFRTCAFGDHRLKLHALIAGIVLLSFGSGPIRGFAYVLVLGIGTSFLPRSWAVTRWCRSFTGAGASSSACRSKGTSMGIFSHSNALPVHEHPQGVVRAVRLVDRRLARLAIVRGLNLGVDFTGGVVVETNFPRLPISRRCARGWPTPAWPARRRRRSAVPGIFWCACRRDPNVKGDQSARVFSRFSARSTAA